MLRCLLIVSFCGFLSTAVHAQNVAAAPYPRTDAYPQTDSLAAVSPKLKRVGHLLRAADHLHAAGRAMEAAELVAEAERLASDATESDERLAVYRRLADSVLARRELAAALAPPAEPDLEVTYRAYRLTQKAIDQMFAVQPANNNQPVRRHDERIARRYAGKNEVLVRGLCSTGLVGDPAPAFEELQKLCDAGLARCSLDKSAAMTNGQGVSSVLGVQFPSLAPLPGGGAAIEFKTYGDLLSIIPTRHDQRILVRFRIAQCTQVAGDAPADEKLAAPTFLDRRESTGHVVLDGQPAFVLAHEIWEDDRTPQTARRLHQGEAEVLEVAVVVAKPLPRAENARIRRPIDSASKELTE